MVKVPPLPRKASTTCTRILAVICVNPVHCGAIPAYGPTTFRHAVAWVPVMGLKVTALNMPAYRVVEKTFYG